MCVHCASLYTLSIDVLHLLSFGCVGAARLESTRRHELLRFVSVFEAEMWYVKRHLSMIFNRFSEIWSLSIYVKRWCVTDWLTEQLLCSAPRAITTDREMHAAGTKESTTKCENKNCVCIGKRASKRTNERERERNLSLPFYSPYNKNQRNNSHLNKEYWNLFKCIKRIIHKNSTVRQTVTQIDKKKENW